MGQCADATLEEQPFTSFILYPSDRRSINCPLRRGCAPGGTEGAGRGRAAVRARAPCASILHPRVWCPWARTWFSEVDRWFGASAFGGSMGTITTTDGTEIFYK